MTRENKSIIVIIALGAIMIGAITTLGIYFIYGERAGYFFMIVLALPLGAISSLLLMILYNAMSSKKN